MKVSMLTTHQAWAEKECYTGKELLKFRCKKTIAVIGDYVPPDSPCIRTVQQSDMACICGIITPREEIRHIIEPPLSPPPSM
ncbi:hypothetical protein EJB05_00080, partial [Eragrostis curvula]